MPPLSIMIKPASSLCNMRCEYCFYRDTASLRENSDYGLMTKATAREIIEKALRFADGDGVSFAFQGGEPLIAGLPYFYAFTDAVRELNRKNSPVCFSVQTNGTLVTEEWARFFHKEKFLVGLSLDGDREDNRLRKTADGQDTWQRVIDAAELLRRYKAEFNILTVLTGYCADNAERIYRFFSDKGFRYLQFIPCLRPFGDKSESELYMTQEQYARFLISLFRLYAKDYEQGRYVSIRQFDNYVGLFLRQEAEQCGMRGCCTFQFVIEANGNVYPCDFYCTDEWLLGNIQEDDFSGFVTGELQKEFIRESAVVPEKCAHCRFYRLCRAGGCKRFRADRDYCLSYTRFFEASLPLFCVFLKEYERQDEKTR